MSVCRAEKFQTPRSLNSVITYPPRGRIAQVLSAWDLSISLLPRLLIIMALVIIVLRGRVDAPTVCPR